MKILFDERDFGIFTIIPNICKIDYGGCRMDSESCFVYVWFH